MNFLKARLDVAPSDGSLGRGPACRTTAPCEPVANTALNPLARFAAAIAFTYGGAACETD